MTKHKIQVSQGFDKNQMISCLSYYTELQNNISSPYSACHILCGRGPKITTINSTSLSCPLCLTGMKLVIQTRSHTHGLLIHTLLTLLFLLPPFFSFLLPSLPCFLSSLLLPLSPSSSPSYSLPLLFFLPLLLLLFLSSFTV